MQLSHECPPVDPREGICSRSNQRESFQWGLLLPLISFQKLLQPKPKHCLGFMCHPPSPPTLESSF